MSRTLYINDGSPPSRAAWMACKAAGMEVEIKRVDILKGVQKEPWFSKMNPRCTVPTLDDNGFYLCESRAIMRYVVDAHSTHHDLYPKDPQKRALVDTALDMDLGSIFKEIQSFLVPQLLRGQPPDEAARVRVCGQLTYLNKETPIAQGNFVAGENMTIADIATLSSIAFLETVEFNLSDYPNLLEWMHKMKAQPFYAECNAGYEHFKAMLKSGKIQVSR